MDRLFAGLVFQELDEKSMLLKLCYTQ